MEEKQFNFGFKSRRPKKEEEVMKFEFPYVEIVPAKGKGSVTKFRLLNGAAELLEFDNDDNKKISYFQNDEDATRFFIANTSDIKASATCRVNSDNSFNSKPLHARICEDLELELTETLYFAVVHNEVEGFEGLTVVEFIDATEMQEVKITDAVSNEPPFKPIDPEVEIPEV